MRAVSSNDERRALTALLAAAGCVAPSEEADELLEAAAGSADALAQMTARRVAGEPLAWVRGGTWFAGRWVRVRAGVYVPRWQTEGLARRAAALLPEEGTAVDLCTGSGAIALALSASRPRARVVGTDIDPLACRCAAENGVEARLGDLAAPLGAALDGRVDVVTAVPPYVPTGAIGYLPRDARDHEPMSALDGGPLGTDLLERVVVAASRLLRPGGVFRVELGAGQDALLAGPLADAGFTTPLTLADDDGDLRGLEARLGRPAAT